MLKLIDWFYLGSWFIILTIITIAIIIDIIVNTITIIIILLLLKWFSLSPCDSFIGFILASSY